MKDRDVSNLAARAIAALEDPSLLSDPERRELVEDLEALLPKPEPELRTWTVYMSGTLGCSYVVEARSEEEAELLGFKLAEDEYADASFEVVQVNEGNDGE